MSTLTWVFGLICLLLSPVDLRADTDTICSVCGKVIKDESLFTDTDKTTGNKVFICKECEKIPDCYICGLPAGSKALTLSDGRHLCPRDAQIVVLDTNQIVQVCLRLQDEADRSFSRFMSFPTNLQVVLIDRIDVDSKYALDGYDVESPNIVGWCQAVTNDLQKTYLIGMMSGRPLAELKSTCVHEYTHAWVGNNVPPARRQAMDRKTEEGFCELMAYLMMKMQHEEKQQQNIVSNLYTRGQVHLFIEAEQRYGLNDVLDWMKYGDAEKLTAGHIDEIHKVTIPNSRPSVSVRAVQAKAVAITGATNQTVSTPLRLPSSPKTIKLDGILWGKKPVAIINGRSFGIDDTDKISLDGQKVALRCLAIEKDFARIQRLDSGEEIKVSLPAN